MANSWYVIVCGEEVRPLSDNQLRQMVANQQLTPTDEIRKATSSSWVRAARQGGIC